METKYAAVCAAITNRRTPVDEVDELNQFLQANARLDLHKKLELLGSAVDVCG
jgi:hypothetical protein